ncbi:LutC/YkgG family protein [Campylobacter lanienae]|uniref:Lactate utilization protein C n=1 Tax=Campylobacter lanienae TaxID=75658 RepID=A0ABY3G9P2_9BACT|nr:lactate utilization protein C [Campylobacter lanienae]TWO30215.1 lactate utilization protein C [Campylobacter lanienae]
MNRIDEISAKSKNLILSRLKDSYKITGHESTPSIDPVEHIQTTDNALTEMKQKMSDNKYIVHECEPSALEDTINEIVASYGYKKMIYGSGLNLNLDKIKADQKICFDKPIEELRSDVFHSEFSIVHAEYGVSSHGVALLKSSQAQPRMLSLAPNLCIVLLKKDKVKNSLVSALNALKVDQNGKLPSNILFIAGPSRTADIELITVFGVHGSQKAHLILY